MSNQPVTDVNLQVMIGDLETVEAKRGPNAYTIPFPDLVHSGSTEVIFSISGGKGDDLLVDSFTPAQPVEPNMRHFNTDFPDGDPGCAIFVGGILSSCIRAEPVPASSTRILSG